MQPQQRAGGWKEEEEPKSPRKAETTMKKKTKGKEDKTKTPKKRDEEREPSSPPPSPPPAASSCSFPMSRVKRLVRSENAAATRITPDAVFLINKASEIFLERFAEDAYARVRKERKKSIDYKHLSSTVYNAKRYEFLSDFVPEKVKAEDALRARVSQDMIIPS